MVLRQETTVNNMQERREIQLPYPEKEAPQEAPVLRGKIKELAKLEDETLIDQAFKAALASHKTTGGTAGDMEEHKKNFNTFRSFLENRGYRVINLFDREEEKTGRKVNNFADSTGENIGFSKEEREGLRWSADYMARRVVENGGGILAFKRLTETKEKGDGLKIIGISEAKSDDVLTEYEEAKNPDPMDRPDTGILDIVEKPSEVSIRSDKKILGKTEKDGKLKHMGEGEIGDKEKVEMIYWKKDSQ